jgi:hypothetical protein
MNRFKDRLKILSFCVFFFIFLKLLKVKFLNINIIALKFFLWFISLDLFYALLKLIKIIKEDKIAIINLNIDEETFNRACSLIYLFSFFDINVLIFYLEDLYRDNLFLLKKKEIIKVNVILSLKEFEFVISDEKI